MSWMWVEWTEKYYIYLVWVELNVGGLGAQTQIGECAFKLSKNTQSYK